MKHSALNDADEYFQGLAAVVHGTAAPTSGMPTNPHKTHERPHPAPTPRTRGPRARTNKHKTKQPTTSRKLRQQRSQVEWTTVARYGVQHDEVPDYVEPGTATIATLNIRGGGDNAKATMLAPATAPDGLLSQITSFRRPDFFFLVELKNANGKCAEFAERFGDAGTAVYVTKHVALVVQRTFLGHNLVVRESQDGRVLQVTMQWHGETTCFTGIYAPGHTDGRAREIFFNQLQVPEGVLHQAVLGDFNHTPGRPGDSFNAVSTDNIGHDQWLNFVHAYELQHFTDALEQDNAGESWRTWQGARAWGTPGNCEKRLDRIELSADLVQIEGAWATHAPWAEGIDHAMVMTTVAGPGQRPPPPQDECSVPPMQLSIIENPEFRTKCLVHISEFDGAKDARDELDILLDKCRVTHDILLKEHRQARNKLARKALALVAKDDDSIAAAATRAAHDAGTGDSGADVQQRWHRDSRAAITAAANDLQCEQHILEADFSHLTAKTFFQQVTLRQPTSTFPFQEPYAPVDDTQILDPHMAHVNDGGGRIGSNVDGWSSKPEEPPSPVASARIYDQSVMLENTRLFYKWLFRERRWHEPSRRRVLEAMREAPCFDSATATRMGAEISPAEVLSALATLQRGKAPGPNGVPSEFFIEFAEDMAELLAKFANTVREKGSFSELQRQGHIVLLWKGKNKGSLPFYRPLSLLNRETSIIECVITMRLAVTLPSCIQHDQTGFLAKDGRRMHENIIKMMDFCSYAADKDVDACAISIDAVKAFDRVSRRLLFELYDVLCGGEPGSNQPLTRWVRALMEGQERRVLVNGEYTESFTLFSGIPQGGILSVISYTLFSESLARLLHHGDAASILAELSTDDEDQPPCGEPAPAPTTTTPAVDETLPPPIATTPTPPPTRTTAPTTKCAPSVQPSDTDSAPTATPTDWIGREQRAIIAAHRDRQERAQLARWASEAPEARTASRAAAEPAKVNNTAPTAPIAARVRPRTRPNHRARSRHTTRRRRRYRGLRGVRTPSRTARLSTVRYADDIVLVLPPSEVAVALDISSGMARNETKTEGMWLGRRRDQTTPWVRTHRLESPGDSCFADDPCADARITWLKPGSSLKVLGVMVGYAVDVRAIWEKIAVSMMTQFRLWRLTRLGYLERVLVCKVMVWSKAFFVAAYHSPPPDIMRMLTAATRCFIQDGHVPAGSTVHTPAGEFGVKALFAGNAVLRPKTEGGLSMWDPAEHLQALLAKWVVLLLEPQKEEATDERLMRWSEHIAPQWHGEGVGHCWQLLAI